MKRKSNTSLAAQTIHRRDVMVAAKTQLLEVMALQADWQEKALKNATSLNQPIIRRAIEELLAEGLIRYRLNNLRMRAIYSLATRHSPDSNIAPILTEDANIVLAHLKTRADTLPTMSTYLRISRARVADAIQALEASGALTSKYIGSICIYRAKDG